MTAEKDQDYEVVLHNGSHSKAMRASGWGVAITLGAAIAVFFQVTATPVVTDCEATSRAYVGPYACVMDPICKLAPQEKADLEKTYKKMTMSCATLRFDEAMALTKKENDVKPATETDPNEKSARPLTE